MASTANAFVWTNSLSFNNPAIFPVPQGFSWTNLQFAMTGQEVVQVQSFTVATMATAIPLGSIGTPRFALFWNLDPVNYISIFNGSMGTEFVRLQGGTCTTVGGNLVGDPCILPLGPSVVPYAQANTSPCQMAFLIASA